MEDITVPAYYVVTRKLTDDADIENVKRALQITPCHTSIITQLSDSALGMMLTQEVLLVESSAEEFAAHLDHPTVVIGNAALLDAVFPDGHREVVNV